MSDPSRQVEHACVQVLQAFWVACSDVKFVLLYVHGSRIPSSEKITHRDPCTSLPTCL